MCTTQASFSLLPQRQWTPHLAFPNVRATLSCTTDTLHVRFDVLEPVSCYRCTCTQDGQPCWQDSCVELFVASAHGYFNFECNPLGICLAEFGTSRHSRRPFLPHQYAQIPRHVLCRATPNQNPCAWALAIDIPLPRIDAHPGDILMGNLYKCASSANTPHYMAAFPIDTPTPDFHRPEYFAPLIAIPSQDLPTP